MSGVFFCPTVLCLGLSSSFVILLSGLVFTFWIALFALSLLDPDSLAVRSHPKTSEIAGCVFQFILTETQTTPTCLSPDLVPPACCELNLWGKGLLRKPLSFFFNYLNFLFWLFWVYVAAHGLSLVAEMGCSSLWFAGFSLQWLLLLQSTGSRALRHGSCGAQA